MASQKKSCRSTRYSRDQTHIIILLLFCTELHILQVVACNQLVELGALIWLSGPQL